jgi:hypothetical protein
MGNLLEKNVVGDSKRKIKKQGSLIIHFIHSDIYPDRCVMPDLIRHPVLSWIPASAGMTAWAMNYGALYSRED